jgi:hypothetical protein
MIPGTGTCPSVLNQARNDLDLPAAFLRRRSRPMSRRCHHGSPRHVRGSGRIPRRPAPSEPIRPAQPGPSQISPTRPPISAQLPVTAQDPERASLAPAPVDSNTAARTSDEVVPQVEGPASSIDVAGPAPLDDARQPAARPRTDIQPHAFGPAPVPREAPARSVHEGENGDADRGATAPQLRRFIKSRAYVPMHELRRRFAINGADDEVTAVDVERRRVFVGLPEREGRLLGELLRGGDIGYELSLDPITPIVVGVYPMRPVTRA